jgi:uncharacterized membrane protein YeaQ/YmgE (transglycosylase-associated protein family)
MDVLYWVLIGVMVALFAKVQFPTDREENVPALLVMGVGGAVVAGLAVQTVARTGVLSTGWASHVAAFAAAVLLVLALRVMTKQHLA